MDNKKLIIVAEKVVKRLRKRLSFYNVDINIILGSQHKNYVIEGNFIGIPNNISNVKINLFLSDFSDIIGKAKLRKWISNITIVFIHEYAHYLRFKNLSLKARADANNKYREYSYFRKKEEDTVWKDTLYILKKYGYLRSKTLCTELKSFEIPDKKLLEVYVK